MTSGVAFDRDKAREALREWLELATLAGWERTLDAMEACVAPAPQLTLDREAVERLLRAKCTIDPALTAGDVLALVRPAEGITLTPEEVNTARDAVGTLRTMLAGFPALSAADTARLRRLRLLAERLELTS